MFIVGTARERNRNDAVTVGVEVTPRRLVVVATPSSPHGRSKPNRGREKCDGGVAFTSGDEASPLLARVLQIQHWTAMPGWDSLSAVKISIIIPAFNEERLLAATLTQINAARAGFAPRGFASELIVCDNNSTDRTAEVARAAGAVVVFEPVNQIGRARNTGAAAATGDWLLFIDADSQPTVELFADVMDQIQSGQCLAGGSTIRLEGGYPLANFVTGVWNWKSRSRRWLAGSFIFCEAAAFCKLGGFNPEMFVGEELDLTARLQELASASGREIVILHRHPLLTSARKVRLYSTWEHLGFLFRVATNREATFRNRAACYAWYDGRR